MTYIPNMDKFRVWSDTKELGGEGLGSVPYARPGVELDYELINELSTIHPASNRAAQIRRMLGTGPIYQTFTSAPNMEILQDLKRFPWSSIYHVAERLEGRSDDPHEWNRARNRVAGRLRSMFKRGFLDKRVPPGYHERDAGWRRYCLWNIREGSIADTG
jgi:hypothetical protein